ncbi:Metal-dependent hydrolase, endonuclease/exonuclease/phosphatase family [Sphingobacterium nematocida]|uniref:Metal-dependent hydrolase, endonuclease/exonuclease/phosphatase family n=1 Tax=Sphingobacterium nematocida TaxID=1513896 RepID=A0A1T5CLS1_9SPHI|nr:endonuclease/exonuclease/phosphatase family protein [Sphingobacterium nematocida]SKB60344.1 Metal-dependent hydrolase, endonuclease/exonuclease/phosphatase family [Sphingobacterium nematocida]
MKKIIITCLFIIGIAVGTRAQHKNENTYQVATFNIRMDTEKDGLDAWPNRKDMVNGLLRYHELDIIGTQEGFRHQLDDIGRIDYLKYVGVGRDDGQQGGEHSAIFYNVHKFSVLDKGDFWYSETPDKPGKGWDAVCCNRICSWVKLKDKKNGKQFFVFSSHFDHQGVKARAESAKLMVKKIAEISKGAPVIALGDFNATPDSEPIVTIKHSLKDAFDITQIAPYGPVGTTNAFKWDAPMKQRIDYIFVNNGVQVLKYASLVDALHMRFPSDHLPVVAKLKID